ncbi:MULTISPECIES: NlpC/P60 family N-terminal domain-containing protein [unclassified Pseudodesulfovibrio]|uniref:SH3 domain-containing protein n=1 Tax=unclassified Pseudodesulfovibrio TaxID=2661612 RepID=UPI000FEBC521|nr:MULTISPECIES: NlpC/P60 family N-terminal domain-containing protein [unclassified Pseudodesulfovibrio]MCJ2166020.1 SH3 domain-containing protein [Pseudodesulfovibrio sp. S3-i]RWU02542.1 glycoside hydrolase [Pseudodesulfovibrio sp. S3]
MIRPCLPALLLLLLLPLAGSGCATKEQDTPPKLITLEQNAGAYHGLPDDTRLLSVEAQAAAYAQFLKEHFDPWDRTKPKHPAEDVFWGLSRYADKKLFGENTLLRQEGWMKRMAMASQVDTYPSLHRRAIAVTNTSMRVLPTNQPAFFDFSRAGEGFPFDYMQNSLVLAGTPLLVTHTSADRAWVMVESRFAFGWVPVTEIAWVNDTFAAAYRTGSYAAITGDAVPVADKKGQYAFTSYIGTLLPVAKGEHPADGFTLVIPARDHQGEAVIHLASISGSDAMAAPIPATPGNFTRLANAMLGQQYGWGGLYENRDCSALTMDLLAGFGIFLPRNSSQQSKLGTIVPLEGLDKGKKKDSILEQGTPFLTLVRKPGHIMLYIGSQDGQPVVLHSVWGLKTRVGDGYGRKIIGKTVITTLEPGQELTELARPEGVILETVRSITTLP